MLANPIETTRAIEAATDTLFEAIDKTTREVVLMIKIMPHTVLVDQGTDDTLQI